MGHRGTTGAASPEQLAELRKLPGAPIGDDADILAMSLPPYYSACPSPDLSDWLEATKPDGYDERNYADPGPFTTDVSEGKSNPFYKAHSYPTKVPHPAIMRFLLHYTQPGDVVLDGFCGTGMTGVAAQACGMPPKRSAAEDRGRDGQGVAGGPAGPSSPICRPRPRSSPLG